MHLLLTGATGFIGSSVARALEACGHQVTAFMRNRAHPTLPSFIDNGDVQALQHMIDDGKVDGVVHLASFVCINHQSSDVVPLLQANVILGARILEACAVSRVKPWFIHAGSTWQDYHHEPQRAVNLYAASKQALDHLGRYYTDAFNIPFVTLKICDTYGPNDPRRKLIPLWLESVDSDEPLQMSAGDQVLDLVFIDDVSLAFCALIDHMASTQAKPPISKAFALSSGRPISLKDLAHLFARATGRTPNILWGARPYREREVMQPTCIDPPVPGFQPRVPLEVGLERLIG